MISEVRYIKRYWDYFLYCLVTFLEGMRKPQESVGIIDDTVETGNGNLHRARQNCYLLRYLPLFPDKSSILNDSCRYEQVVKFQRTLNFVMSSNASQFQQTEASLALKIEV